jgi:hypothetical protein
MRNSERAAIFWRMTVEEIKAAIPKLTVEERAELARCLHGWEDDGWDAQMKRDLAAGKLDKLLKKVDADIREAISTNVSWRDETPFQQFQRGCGSGVLWNMAQPLRGRWSSSRHGFSQRLKNPKPKL